MGFRSHEIRGNLAKSCSTGRGVDGGAVAKMKGSARGEALEGADTARPLRGSPFGGSFRGSFGGVCGGSCSGQLMFLMTFHGKSSEMGSHLVWNQLCI